MRILIILTLLLLFGCGYSGPKSKSIHVPPDSTWSTLRDNLVQVTREGWAFIKVNGAPFYFPDYYPYGDPDKGPEQKEEPPRVITATESVDVVESWISTFHLKGAEVRIDSDVPVSRVTRLAEIFDRHRITAGWDGCADPGSSITIWQTSILHVLPPPITTNAEPAGGALRR